VNVSGCSPRLRPNYPGKPDSGLHALRHLPQFFTEHPAQRGFQLPCVRRVSAAEIGANNKRRCGMAFQRHAGLLPKEEFGEYHTDPGKRGRHHPLQQGQFGVDGGHRQIKVFAGHKIRRIMRIAHSD